jgi:hypothetical protein
MHLSQLPQGHPVRRQYERAALSDIEQRALRNSRQGKEDKPGIISMFLMFVALAVSGIVLAGMLYSAREIIYNSCIDENKVRQQALKVGIQLPGKPTLYNSGRYNFFKEEKTIGDITRKFGDQPLAYTYSRIPGKDSYPTIDNLGRMVQAPAIPPRDVYHFFLQDNIPKGLESSIVGSAKISDLGTVDRRVITFGPARYQDFSVNDKLDWGAIRFLTDYDELQSNYSDTVLFLPERVN